jgi:hypothetical protein
VKAGREKNQKTHGWKNERINLMAARKNGIQIKNERRNLTAAKKDRKLAKNERRDLRTRLNIWRTR